MQSRAQQAIRRYAARLGLDDDGIIRVTGDTFWENQKERDVRDALERHETAHKPAASAPQGRDQQATAVADALGVPAPQATGRCHYCGLPLTTRRVNVSRTGGEVYRNRSYCEECD